MQSKEYTKHQHPLHIACVSRPVQAQVHRHTMITHIQASHYHNLQCVQLGETNDYFYPLVACMAPSSSMKASQ